MSSSHHISSTTFPGCVDPLGGCVLFRGGTVLPKMDFTRLQALKRCNLESANFVKIQTSYGGVRAFGGAGGVGRLGGPHVPLKVFQRTSTRNICIIKRGELSMPEWTSLTLSNIKCKYYRPHFVGKDTIVMFVFDKK